jgi:hypothetical protein
MTPGLAEKAIIQDSHQSALNKLRASIFALATERSPISGQLCVIPSCNKMK